MKSFILSLALLLLCNFSLFAQIQPDTIKTIDPYDEIVWEITLNNGISDVAYHPNGLSVFAACGSVIYQRDAKDGAFIKQYWSGNSDNGFIDMDLSKDGKLITGCGTFNYIPVFNVETGQEKIRLYDTLFGFTEYRSVSFSPDGTKLVVTAGKSFYGSGVLLFDVETGKRLASTYNQSIPNNEKGYMNYHTIKYLDAENIILPSYNNNILFKLSGDSLKIIKSKIINAPGFNSYSNDNIYSSSDGKSFVLCGSYSGAIWDNKDFIETQQLEIMLPGSVLINKNVSKMILIGLDIINSLPVKICKVFDLNTSKILLIYKSSLGFRASLSPNDSLFVHSNGDQKLQLVKAKWDAQTSVNNEPQLSFNIFNVFPNPGTNLLNVNLTSNISSNIKLEILNLNALVLLTQNRDIIERENNITLPISNIPNGSYTLRVTMNNIIKQINFIINR